MPDSAKRPIENDELIGAAVMALSVSRMEALVEDFDTRLVALGRIVECQFEVLKQFSDLYLELTDRTEERKAIQRMILRAERESARLKLPLWFWRPEDNLALKNQLYRRALYLLFEHKTGLDDTWDLIREYLKQCRPEEVVTDDQLVRLIAHAKQKGGIDACP